MNKVVVTGLGCISPVGKNVPSFWANAVQGRHGIAPISRFDASDIKAKVAAEVKDFDPDLYLAKNEQRKTDLFAQYALAAAAQALDDSGVAGQVEPERLGVYIGSGIGGISTSLAETEKMMVRGPNRVSPFYIPMLISNMAGALIAIKYGALGPNLPVVTACATSGHAIGEAFRAIKYGYADAIMAGGSEAAINKLALAGFANSMAVTTTDDPDSASIPFDRRRSGFVIGEGAAVIVLENYELALARGARIYCQISGYANTCDAHHITAPHPEAVGAAQAISLAFAEAKTEPGPKLYINPHGTSTPLNDKTETLAIKKALGDLAWQVPISSTKGVTGHMLGAAGCMEAIAAILALKNNLVPPTAGYRQPDPDCDLDYVPGSSRAMEIDQALSLSLGFGGHNAALLFERI